MNAVHAVDLAVHVGAGAIGLAVGLVPLASRKGGRAHRRWGRWFAALAMLVVGAAILSDLFASPSPALVAVTLAAAYQLAGSLRALALRGRVPGGVDAALALAALLIAGLLARSANGATASFTPLIQYSTLGWVATIAVYDLSRHAWAQAWSRSFQPLDHGLKMTGVWVAMASAGAGNLLRDWQPWSQLLPNLLGTALMIAFALRHWPRRAAATAA